MRRVLIFGIGAILGGTLKTIGCDVCTWQYWVCLICLCTAYAIGLFTD